MAGSGLAASIAATLASAEMLDLSDEALAAAAALFMAPIVLVTSMFARRRMLGNALLICTGAPAATLALMLQNAMGYLLAASAAAAVAAALAGRRQVDEWDQAARAALQQSACLKNRLDLILEERAEPPGVFLAEVDAHGRIAYASSGLARMAGAAPASLQGQLIDGLFPPDRAAGGWHRLLMAVHARQATTCVIEITQGGEQHYWQVDSRPQPNGVSLIGRNVTPERLYRQRLVAERDQALLANVKKLQFLEIGARALRAPLNTIIGFAEHLQSPAAADTSEAHRRACFDMLLASSRRLLALSGDIGDLSRMERRRMKLVEQDADAAELAETSVKSCACLAESADVTIRLAVYDGVTVLCDQTRLQQALVNMIARALQFSPPGGLVDVMMGRTPDQGLEITVKDQGAALQPHEIERCFDPLLVNLERDGLGLPMARRIARMHGGDVTLESATGGGTTLRMVLPSLRVRWSADLEAVTQAA